MKSEGENTVGFTQSLADLDYALKTLKADEKYKDKSFAVIGHSWGGYSTLNISAFHQDLTHIVVLSGPSSVERITEQFGPLKKSIRAIEKQANPVYADCDGVKSLKNTRAKALLIYSDNVKMVNTEQHFDYLKAGLADRENTFFLLEKGKDHNPNYTADAVKYLGEYLAELNKKQKQLKTAEQKKVFVSSFDWKRMTSQDERVWSMIFEWLDK
jgi:pimeloyl-ACP methyl ester carboxylesterase